MGHPIGGPQTNLLLVANFLSSGRLAVAQELFAVHLQLAYSPSLWQSRELPNNKRR